ncbi:MAG: hypothetical protein ACYDHH_30410 [Solirubrobacteraceae bacterium]
MDDLDRLVDLVRTRARALLAGAHDAMEAGAPIDRVMDHYVRQALDLEAEADTRAVLVSAGDPDAIDEIVACLSKLEALRGQFDAEFGDQA